jgi:hypothetical protein
MRNPAIKALALGAGLVFGATAMADDMTHAQYESQEQGIKADYKAAKARCDAMKGHAEDVCEAEAKGNASVARAELEARHEPTARNIEDARKARAEANYSVAMERCDDKSGNAEDVCEKDAKAALAEAKARLAQH